MLPRALFMEVSSHERLLDDLQFLCAHCLCAPCLDPWFLLLTWPASGLPICLIVRVDSGLFNGLCFSDHLCVILSLSSDYALALPSWLPYITLALAWPHFLFSLPVWPWLEPRPCSHASSTPMPTWSCTYHGWHYPIGCCILPVPPQGVLCFSALFSVFQPVKPYQKLHQQTRLTGTHASLGLTLSVTNSRIAWTTATMQALLSL